MCLRNSSSPIQCGFAMRLRHPTRLHNASAPANASAHSNASSPNASSECVCACKCLRLLSLFLTNASSQCGCVFRSFATLPPKTPQCIYAFRYTDIPIYRGIDIWSGVWRSQPPPGAGVCGEGLGPLELQLEGRPGVTDKASIVRKPYTSRNSYNVAQSRLLLRLLTLT